MFVRLPLGGLFRVQDPRAHQFDQLRAPTLSTRQVVSQRHPTLITFSEELSFNNDKQLFGCV